jgi:hypothetical protein
MSTTLLLLFAIASAVIAYIPAKPIIIDPAKQGIKQIKSGGWVFLIAIAALVVLPLIQDYFQKRNEETKDKQVKEDEKAHDRMLKKSYDSSLQIMKDKSDVSNQKTTGIISETLGKYGYQLDSVKRELRVIRDSSKTKIFMGDDPILLLDNSDGSMGIELKGVSQDTTFFKMCFVSDGAPSSFFDIKASVVAAIWFENTPPNLIYCFKYEPLSYQTKLPKDKGIITSFYIYRIPFNYIYIWIRGKYKNTDESKTFSIDQVYFYNMNGKTFGNIEGDVRKNIITNILEHEK